MINQQSFLNSQSGAVTVDWVVLTAGLLGLGLATMGLVSAGVQDTAGDIDGQLKYRHVSKTMDQFTYGALSNAIQTRYDLGDPRFNKTADKTFAGHMNTYRSWINNWLEDPENHMSPMEHYTSSVEHGVVAENLGQLDPDTVTAAQIAAVEQDTWLDYASNRDEAYTQDKIDTLAGGDAGLYLSWLQAEHQMHGDRAQVFYDLAEEHGEI